jgi:dihydropyrimidine dehydrogenase (NADP+)
MKVPQIRDPSLTPLDQLPESFQAKVALIGCVSHDIVCFLYNVIQ